MANRTRPTVLAVDDEPGILEAVRVELEDDFDVLTTSSGGAALDVLTRRDVDAVLLDLRMPEMEGTEVLRRLRTLGSRPPVIVMTVVREPKTVVECITLGASDYLTKPWEDGEPAATIRRILRELAAAPSVLLVSDEPAALAPVHLALEAHVRVVSLSVANAFASDLSPLVVVVHAAGRAPSSALTGLPARFPRAAVVWVSNGPTADGGSVVPLHGLDLILDRISSLLGAESVPRRPLSRALLAAVDHMVETRGDLLTIDEIAHRVCVSEGHLSRLFREAFGLPAAAYYTRLRIAIACRLLKDTEAKMDDVAQQVGFSGAANLSRAFKGVMGIPPGQFRRSAG